MTMRIIGDVHGKIARYLEKIQDVKESFQVGDMELGFDNDMHLPNLMIEGESHRFIRGNHDSPALCLAHPNYAGEYGFDQQHNLFFCGGAFSIDWQWRQEAERRKGTKLWWRGEELFQPELDAAFRLYEEKKPRFVITHDCPRNIAIRLLREIAINFRPEKDVPSRTSLAFQKMYEIHQPEIWIFGHYHINKDFKDKTTRFICLNELSVIDLDI